MAQVFILFFQLSVNIFGKLNLFCISLWAKGPWYWCFCKVIFSIDEKVIWNYLWRSGVRLIAYYLLSTHCMLGSVFISLCALFHLSTTTLRDSYCSCSHFTYKETERHWGRNLPKITHIAGKWLTHVWTQLCLLWVPCFEL